MLVFDLSSKESFNHLKKWEKLLKENGINNEDSIIFVVGNKSDLKSKLVYTKIMKQVDYQEASKYSKNKGFEYFQASACSGENVQEV